MIRYIGVGSNVLKEYCHKEGINNTFFHDRFRPEETINFYSDTDFILNLYGHGTPFLDYALSNKLYYAATLRIPILVCPGTYMEEISTKYGFGVTMDINEKESADIIVNCFRRMDNEKMLTGCKQFCEIVEKDNIVWKTKVREALGC